MIVHSVLGHSVRDAPFVTLDHETGLYVCTNKHHLAEAIKAIPRLCYDAILHIMRLLSATVTHVVIDGTAPYPKIAQQMMRRHHSWRIYDADKRHILFTSSLVTPFTEFMQALCLAIMGLVANDAAHDIHFHNYSVPEEGEHKIVDLIDALIKSEPRAPRSPLNICVCSSDNDLLLLLGMICPCVPKIYFCRTNIDSDSKRGLFKINVKVINIMDNVSMILRHHRMLNIEQSNVNPLLIKKVWVDFFIIVTIVAGNDFLPKSHVTDDSVRALEYFCAQYCTFVNQKAAMEDRFFLTDDNGNLDIERLQAFLAIVRAEITQLRGSSYDLVAEEEERDRGLSEKYLETELGAELGGLPRAPHNRTMFAEKYLNVLRWVVRYYQHDYPEERKKILWVPISYGPGVAPSLRHLSCAVPPAMPLAFPYRFFASMLTIPVIEFSAEFDSTEDMFTSCLAFYRHVSPYLSHHYGPPSVDGSHPVIDHFRLFEQFEYYVSTQRDKSLIGPPPTHPTKSKYNPGIAALSQLAKPVQRRAIV